MNKNEYGEVINRIDTYREIAKQLLLNKSVGIGWTDEYDTHFDIIFTLGVEKYGLFQRGIKTNDLFVSIIDWSSYGFNADTIKEGTYIQEKLRLGNYEKLGEKVKKLVNGVIEYLNKGK